jgi:hypothetical protein
MLLPISALFLSAHADFKREWASLELDVIGRINTENVINLLSHLGSVSGIDFSQDVRVGCYCYYFCWVEGVRYKQVVGLE